MGDKKLYVHDNISKTYSYTFLQPALRMVYGMVVKLYIILKNFINTIFKLNKSVKRI